MKNMRISIFQIIRYHSKINLVLNFIIFCFIFPHIFYNLNNILSSFIGFIILFAWFSNIVLLYLVDRFLIKGRNNKTKLNKTSYRFLLSFSSCIFLIIASLILSNLIVTGTSFIIGITISYLFQIIGFLIISISGIKLSYEVIIFTCNKKKSKETINPININSIRKKIVKSICYFINGIGIYSVIVLLVPIEFFSPELAIVIPQISLFLIFIFILNTLIILKLTPRSYDDTKKSKFSFLRIKSIAKRKHFRQGILVMGILLSFIFSLPILSTPFSIIHAENEFRDVYGDNWRNFIPSNISRFFLESQFNIYNYFMGIPHKDCNIELDILYYEKNDTKLYLDVYYPKVSGESLPGNNSIIIKIHGGAWKVGDKGTGNTPIISKYLANQGYVVFDIQYGLMEFQNGGLDLTPEYVQGNFTLHDMVYQIGNFTKQLETTYASEYNGNLDSVFIMGGSAGGHLTSVIGLGYNDPYFSGNFSNAIKLKGIIPLYPPNSAEHYFNRFEFKDLIPGDPTTNPLAFKKFTPSNLVSLNDPPALIFQGTQDRLVPPINSEQIEKAIEGIGNDCIRLIFYFATHCNDMITNNNFAQIWLYYLERFLFLNR